MGTVIALCLGNSPSPLVPDHFAVLCVYLQVTMFEKNCAEIMPGYRIFSKIAFLHFSMIPVYFPQFLVAMSSVDVKEHILKI